MAENLSLGEDTKVKILRSKILVALGNRDDAEKILETTRSDTNVHLERMKLTTDLRKVRSIMQFCEEPTLEMHVEFIRKLAESGQTDTALRHAQSVQGLSFKQKASKELTVELEILLAKMLGKQGKSADGFQILKELHHNHPNNVKILEELGQFMYDLGDLNKAIFYYEQALHILPNSKSITKKMVQSLLGMHDYASALAFYDRCRHDAFRIPLIKILLKSRQFQQAEKLAQESDMDRKEEVLGDIYFESRQSQPMMQSYEKALLKCVHENDTERFSNISYKLAIWHCRMSKYDEASKYLNTAMEKFTTVSQEQNIILYSAGLS